MATAHGNVRLTRDGQALEAPYVQYNLNSSAANAHGGLLYYKPGLFLKAQKGAININSSTGVFSKVTYKLPHSSVRGHAATVDSKSKQHYRLSEATYTTCPLNSPTWYISATHVDLNQKSGRGDAWNAVMHLYGLPIFYTPYFSFPIDNRRHTGFLAPYEGHSSQSGFSLATPYYINLAPQYDLTLIPRYYGKRGFQIGALGRYQFKHQKGNIAGQYLPYDQRYGGSRSFVHFQDQGQFNKYIGFQADYNRASDKTYFKDFKNGPTGTSTSVLERGAQLTFATTGARLNVLVQDFQTLYPTSHRTSFYNVFNYNPYKRLPSVQLHLLSPTAPFQLGLNASYTNFVSGNPNAVEAQRYNAKPKLIWSIDHGGWFVNSQAAYEFTHYSLSNVRTTGPNRQSTSINRGIPSFKLRSGLRFSRTMSNGWIQTLTPEAEYLFTAYDNQKNIPIFDSGMPQLHYQRLFASNRFTGIDRIGDANQITLGASTRIYSPDSGRRLAKLELGRVTSLRKLKVTLPNSSLTGYSNYGSDFVGRLTLSPLRQIQLLGSVAYSGEHSRIDRGRAEFLYATKAGYGVNLGYRYYRGYRPARGANLGPNGTIQLRPNQYDTLKQIAIKAYAPLGQHFKAVGRWNYSLEINQTIETIAGIQYSPSCCIAAQLSWRRYVDNRGRNGKFQNSIVFQFVFRGFEKLGNTSKSFVSNNIFNGVKPGRSRNTYNTLQTQ